MQSSYIKRLQRKLKTGLLVCRIVEELSTAIQTVTEIKQDKRAQAC